MKVIVLAGGIGKRYNIGQDETDNIPKCLVCIESKHTILDSNLKTLLKFKEVEEVLIVTGFKHNLIEDHLRLFYTGNNIIKTIYNPKYQDSIIYSVKKGFKKINNTSSVLLLNGDTYFKSDIFKKAADISVKERDTITLFGHLTNEYYNDDMLTNVIGRKMLNVGKDLREANGVSSGAILMCYRGLQKYLNTINLEPINRLKKTHHGILQFISDSGFDIDFVDLGGRKWFEVDEQADLDRVRKYFAIN
tara:strand:+ start:1615 stop:2358 length:744 start_codon:yes stop_codon:yes gene_type:complete